MKKQTGENDGESIRKSGRGSIEGCISKSRDYDRVVVSGAGGVGDA